MRYRRACSLHHLARPLITHLSSLLCSAALLSPPPSSPGTWCAGKASARRTTRGRKRGTSLTARPFSTSAATPPPPAGSPTPSPLPPSRLGVTLQPPPLPCTRVVLAVSPRRRSRRPPPTGHESPHRRMQSDPGRLISQRVSLRRRTHRPSAEQEAEAAMEEVEAESPSLTRSRRSAVAVATVEGSCSDPPRESSAPSARASALHSKPPPCTCMCPRSCLLPRLHLSATAAATPCGIGCAGGVLRRARRARRSGVERVWQVRWVGLMHNPSRKARRSRRVATSRQSLRPTTPRPPCATAPPLGRQSGSAGRGGVP